MKIFWSTNWHSLLDIHLLLSVCPNLTFVMRYPWLRLGDGSDTGNWGPWSRTWGQACPLPWHAQNLEELLYLFLGVGTSPGELEEQLHFTTDKFRIKWNRKRRETSIKHITSMTMWHNASTLATCVWNFCNWGLLIFISWILIFNHTSLSLSLQHKQCEDYQNNVK